MKYETPEVTVLTSAIDAIQSTKDRNRTDNGHDAAVAYEDWE